MKDYEFLKSIGVPSTSLGRLGYDEEDPDEDLSWITGVKVDNKNANTALKDKDVTSMISTITTSSASVADKVLAFQNLKAQTENSIQAYQLALDNNTTSLSIAEINYQVAQLQLQQSVIESETKRLQSTNHTTMTKYIVGGLAVLGIAFIVGFVALKKK